MSDARLRARLALMGIDAEKLPADALEGAWTAYKADSVAPGTTVINIDQSGGFLLDAIVCVGNEAMVSQFVPGTFQIADSARRELFSTPVLCAAFSERTPAIDLPNEPAAAGVAGQALGQLPVGVYFNPSSSIVVTKRGDPDYGECAAVYLFGYRFRNGKPLPAPARQFYGYGITTQDGAGEVRIEAGSPFTVMQVAAALAVEEGNGHRFDFAERFNLKDANLSRYLFDDPVPLALFQTPMGDRFGIDVPHTYGAGTTVQMSLRDADDLDGLTRGFYLWGHRRYA